MAGWFQGPIWAETIHNRRLKLSASRKLCHFKDKNAKMTAMTSKNNLAGAPQNHQDSKSEEDYDLASKDYDYVYVGRRASGLAAIRSIPAWPAVGASWPSVGKRRSS